MLRRPFLLRALSGCMAMWFALSTALPTLLHPCPMHDAPGVASHAGVSGHVHHAPVPQRDDPPPGHQHCSCPGACTSVASGALPAATTRFVLAVAVSLRASAISGWSYHPVAPEFALPFANGPPALI